LGECLAPLLRGSECSNLLLYGKTGTGKTAVTRHVLKKLQEKSNQANINIRFAYSNTRTSGTEYRVLSDLAQAINIRIPFTGLALAEVSERILSSCDETHLKVVLILDEVDFLVKRFGDDLLYELTRANSRLQHAFISIIGISNDLKFKEFLDPRVISSLSEEEIVFPPYTAQELQTILKERSLEAFRAGVVSEVALNLCAALAGSEHGDARRAVDLLRVSGEVAERESSKTVEERHVRMAVQRIEQDRMVDALRSLPVQEKLVLLAVLSRGTAESTGEVYQHYLSLSKRSGLEPLTQRRVSGLLSELDLMGLVSANIISHGRYGRTKKISALVSKQLVTEIFHEDPVLSSLT